MVLLAQTHAQQITIQMERQPPVARVTATGSAPGHITFEGTSDLGGQWDMLSMLPSSEAQQGWVHAKSGILPRQFYRAVWRGDYEEPFADDFRLIDHQGISRQLLYYFNHTNTKAFVLIFTGNGCSTVQQYMATLN